jgi:hypothetical protein
MNDFTNKEKIQLILLKYKVAKLEAAITGLPIPEILVQMDVETEKYLTLQKDRIDINHFNNY